MKDELIKLTEAWQKKWSVMQDHINTLVSEHNYRDALMMQVEVSRLKSCIKDVYSLLYPENTGGVSSDSSDSLAFDTVLGNGTQAVVTDEDSESLVGGTLGKRTDTERFIVIEIDTHQIPESMARNLRAFADKHKPEVS